MHNRIVYVGVGPGLIERSTDGGDTWDTIPEPPAAGQQGVLLASLAIAPSNDSILYAGYTTGIYKSTDKGTTWHLVDLGPTVISGGGVVLDPKSADTAYAAVEVAGNLNAIFKSTDGGVAWLESDSGMNTEGRTIMSVAINPANPSQVIVGLRSDSVAGPLCFESTNAGDSWISFTDGLPSTGVVNCIVVDTSNNRIYCGFGGDSSGGIYVRSTVTGIKGNGTNLLRFNRAQNYPNPFNPTTKIHYQLPKDARVTIRIYDVLGREVATLVDGEKPAGYHEVSFNGSQLASGVYFYRFTAPGVDVVKKMLLLK
ncbi:MAG: T9SS type A sorting domain-containing protein [Bacteroidetes bacterium]|nr:T9SS type A sorting domain-containing protein [Bacteroidota bacterium]